MPAKGSRYVPCKLSGFFGSSWGVEDLSYVPAKLITDWSKQGSNKIWKGTEGAARDLAQLLNQRGPDHDKITKEVKSGKQRVIERNIDNRQKTALDARKSARSAATHFTRCACGAMFKGDKHCDASVT